MSSILIYRGIGGIGDALCTTFPLKLFLEKNKTLFNPIDVAFPLFTHPVFEGVIPVLDSKHVIKSHYDNVIDLGDPCPAAAYEARYKGKVKMSRAQLFAKGLGLDPALFEKTVPLMFFSAKEKGFIDRLFQTYRGNVVGVTLHSSEGYRDYPHTVELLNTLVLRKDIDHIFLFGTKLPKGIKDSRKFITFIKTDLRRAFCAQVRCDSIITVDSLFLHSAGALGKPIILIDGPLTSEYRFASYKPVIVNSGADCLPCWRNGRLPCVFEPFDAEKSKCMADVTVSKVVEMYDTHIKKNS